MIEAYILHLLILIGIYAILAISLNLVVGYTGIMNIGHAAFYGVGAYVSALLALKLGLPFWLDLIIGAIIASVFGLLLVLPSVKLRADYLALATLGFGVVVETIFRNWTSVTRGALGLPGIPKPVFFGIEINSLLAYFMLVAIFVVITYLIIRRIVNSPFGRVLKAIREDEMVAASVGKNVIKYKTIVLAVSAFFAGIAGSLYAHYITFIDPSSFTVMESILIISMIIIGGLASVRGAVIGAAILILLPEPLRFLPIPSFAVGAVRVLIYSAILVTLIINRPQGIFGEFTFKRKI